MTKPTPEPTPTRTTLETPAPSDSGSPADSASPTASGTPNLGPGAICSGSTENKEFWTSAAAQLMWDVYCPVLPGGWFVIDGSYKLTNGGTIDISYKGPGGGQIRLQEGSFCTSGLSACQPHDQVLGTASFGDRSGSLDTLGPGMGFAIYIDPGSAPSWAITGTGMDQASFAAIAAALTKVPKS